MKIRCLAWMALVASAVLAAPAAAQEGTVAALRNWGLLGVWSLRCDLPVSANNYYYGYVVEPDGRASMRTGG